MVEAQHNRIKELEDEVQSADNAKLRLEVNMQAFQTKIEKDRREKEQGEIEKRSLIREV